MRRKTCEAPGPYSLLDVPDFPTTSHVLEAARVPVTAVIDDLPQQTVHNSCRLRGHDLLFRAVRLVKQNLSGSVYNL